MGWGAIESVADVLVEPDAGGPKLRGHDKTFGEIRDGFDKVRDECNRGIDLVNSALELAKLDYRAPRLTEDSLDEFVVYPLSGDYARIQQNGAACKILRQGMDTWATNMTQLGLNSLFAFQGKVQGSFVLHLGAYATVMAGVGRVMSSGSTVYDSIAKVSEKIAIKVEKMLVEMGKKLLKLSKTLLKRFGGGWLSIIFLIKDLAEKGLGVITDIIDDLTWCIEAIQKCFTLVEEVKAWAHTQADRLKKFEELVGLVKNLPKVDLNVPLDQIKIPDDLEDIVNGFDPGAGETEEGKKAEEDLLEAGDDLVGDSGYVDPSWAAAGRIPPKGQESVPYDPTNPEHVLPRNPFTGEIDTTKPLTPPVPGVSDKEYYKLYERWRESLRPPLHAPPATGKPAKG